MRHRLLVLHQFDPRGTKVGGIETHVRHLLRHHPDDFSLVLAGIDEIGDLTPGKLVDIEVGGRRVGFLPVARFPAEAISGASKSLLGSLTLRYGLGLLRHLPALRRALGDGPASIEVQRYEPAIVAALLRRPMLAVIHNEYSRSNKTDSLMTRFWAVHQGAEALALRTAGRIVCVNDNIRRYVATVAPRHAHKAVVMSVPVDTAVFKPSPLDTSDGIMRLVYTGRLEAQKDPGLMFETVARLGERLGGRVELHYVGTSRPEDYAEFVGIADRTIQHGFQSPEGVARIVARCHAGLLTSNFEGMPCFILEVLAAGRPMAAIRLPQFDAVIRDGVTGVMVERQATQAASAEALATSVQRLWTDLQAGRYDPEAISSHAAPFSIANELPRHFALHRELQQGPGSPRVATSGVTG